MERPAFLAALRRIFFCSFVTERSTRSGLRTGRTKVFALMRQDSYCCQSVKLNLIQNQYLQLTVSVFDNQVSNAVTGTKVFHMDVATSTIGTRIRQARTELKMTAAEFADALGDGCTKASVYHWEAGRSDVPDKFYKHMDRLGINVRWLLTGEGEVLMASDSQPKSSGNARIVGHVGQAIHEPAAEYGVKQEGVVHIMDMMNVVGLELKRHSTQLNDHEVRITRLETVIEAQINT